MMDKKNNRFPSTFTVDNFSSTTTLTPNEIKVPIGNNNTKDEKQYNPYEHRHLEHPNTFIGALTHILKSSLGTGILAIPMAFKYAGLLPGLVGTALIGALCTHAIHMLVRASQRMSVVARLPSLGFSETAHAVFKYGPESLRPWANFSRIFVDSALILTYFFGNSVYIVFIGSSLKQVSTFYFPSNHISEFTFMLATMVGLLILCQIRPLKFLVPFSAIANISLCTAFIITFYYMFHKLGSGEAEESLWIKGVGGLPKFLVTVIFAMEGIGTILPVENSMLKPNFLGLTGVLNVAMAAVVVLYTSIGFFGYFIYGETTKASITFCLPDDENLAAIGHLCIAAAVFFTFMLQFYVPMEISWRLGNHYFPTKYHDLVQIIWRLISVTFITAIAVSVPDLGTIIDIVGSVFFSTLGLFIPATLDIIVNWERGLGRFQWKLYKNIVIICIAIFALVSGTYFAISDLLTKPSLT